MTEARWSIRRNPRGLWTLRDPLGRVYSAHRTWAWAWRSLAEVPAELHTAIGTVVQREPNPTPAP